jgi:hypothetical protein
MITDVKKPRGRPAMSCDAINEKSFQRKKEATIKQAQLKKCAARADHPHKACKIENNKCVVATATKVKKQSCGEVRPKPISEFGNNKKDQRNELVKRCTEMGSKIHKTCKVPNIKKLVCHDSKLGSKNNRKKTMLGLKL